MVQQSAKRTAAAAELSLEGALTHPPTLSKAINSQMSQELRCSNAQCDSNNPKYTVLQGGIWYHGSDGSRVCLYCGYLAKCDIIRPEEEDFEAIERAEIAHKQKLLEEAMKMVLRDAASATGGSDTDPKRT